MRLSQLLLDSVDFRAQAVDDVLAVFQHKRLRILGRLHRLHLSHDLIQILNQGMIEYRR